MSVERCPLYLPREDEMVYVIPGYKVAVPLRHVSGELSLWVDPLRVNKEALEKMGWLRVDKVVKAVYIKEGAFKAIGAWEAFLETGVEGFIVVEFPSKLYNPGDENTLRVRVGETRFYLIAPPGLG